ncbi:MAG: hypothetical protein J7K40_13395 [candidate division Zixibacteria bacterium]|nr:hypothetical protein [candidate division Zixibacteria bacterium]
MIRLLIISLCLIGLLIGCGSQSPREVAMEFIGSVIEDDSLAIEEHFDVDSMVKRRMQEVPPIDSTETPEYFRNRIIQNLTGDGGTRAFWKRVTAVINQELIVGDTAEVELTLLDKEYGKTHYSKLYLYKSDKGWRVFYFL